MAASKEAVKGIVRQCESGEGAAIPEEDYDSDGDLDNSKIFCAICRANQSTDVSTHFPAPSGYKPISLPKASKCMLSLADILSLLRCASADVYRAHMLEVCCRRMTLFCVTVRAKEPSTKNAASRILWRQSLMRRLTGCALPASPRLAAPRSKGLCCLRLILESQVKFCSGCKFSATRYSAACHRDFGLHALFLCHPVSGGSLTLQHGL